MSPVGPVAIRADGGGTIGMGHLHRCAALAEALEAAGAPCLFLTQTPDALAGLWSGRIAPADDAALADQLDALEAALLVGDWKSTPLDAVRSVRRNRPVVLIGGDADTSEADLVIRQGFIPCENEDSLSGADYILLKPGFRDAPLRQTRQAVSRLLISLGGGMHKESNAVVDAVAALPEARDWEIILTDKAALKRARQRHGEAGLRWTAPNRTASLAKDMGIADLAILAGGTTLHEAAAAGLPVICLPVADNQRRRAAALDRLGLGILADPDAPGDIAAPLLALARDPARRAAMAARGQALVDGRGATRCAAAIIALVRGRAAQA